MSDGTPERIALELMQIIAVAERKDLIPPAGKDKTMADRAWILQTYAECLKMIHGPRTYSERKAAQDRS
jgi:hypothetical protein